MKIPKVISKNGRQYIFVKEYPNFIQYKDMYTEAKESFCRQELGLVEETNIMQGFKANPDNVKI